VSPGEVINHVNGGKLKTLVVMADERMKTMPDVPTLKEKGVDLSIGTWRGLIVSQKTPQDVVDVLAKAAKETAEEPAFQDALQKLNLNYAWLDAASFQTQISEQEKHQRRLEEQITIIKNAPALIRSDSLNPSQ
ncbi:tripartite tricarboxylate transporter substrate-binding protein, partial [Escherichia coli]|uniref:tripartite tricarboxylate transporter substrate-binding protein n=1 Tax=Escherichia coli TaxID=562 RepID=UPI002118CBBB